MRKAVSKKEGLECDGADEKMQNICVTAPKRKLIFLSWNKSKHVKVTENKVI